ncbi:SDR family oxidoreductase, partial [Streptomyces parvus]
ASKGALTSAVYSLAQELGPDRIRVNTVLPGWLAFTHLTRKEAI